MHRDQPRLTRDQLIAIISDFYVFLTKLHIPSSALKFPPPDGWPNITPETMKESNKSPMVIDLIKHLPYIEEDDYDNPTFVRFIHYKSQVVNYSTCAPDDLKAENIAEPEMFLQIWVDEMEQRKAENGDDDEDEEEVNEDDDNEGEEDGGSDANSQHSNDSGITDMNFQEEDWWHGDDPDEIVLRNMITLAVGHESGGRTLVLDVFKGNIHEDIVRYTSVSGVTIESFFDGLRNDYEKLMIVPTPEEFYETEEGDADDELQEYIDIYKEHGWPGEGFKKEEALIKIKACRERQSIREDEVMKMQAEERERRNAIETVV
jgi:hypothetical protein